MFIPASNKFNWSSIPYKDWCINNELFIPSDGFDIVGSVDTVKTRFNGKSQTEKILAAAAANSKPNNYFPAADFCKSFTPGFKDGEWYLPAIGELLVIQKSYNIIEKVLIKVRENFRYYWGIFLELQFTEGYICL